MALSIQWEARPGRYDVYIYIRRTYYVEEMERKIDQTGRLRYGKMMVK